MSSASASSMRLGSLLAGPRFLPWTTRNRDVHLRERQTKDSLASEGFYGDRGVEELVDTTHPGNWQRGTDRPEEEQIKKTQKKRRGTGRPQIRNPQESDPATTDQIKPREPNNGCDDGAVLNSLIILSYS
ncbi:predicted protein [Histoplasma capsulatum H143]|uniref:Uncharacterized protein n=1 Tax=Ajellomyces capsulatus (strain H143) TaxID=544712 RepID=C6HR70_AJECH|nr:predicted protein [Histoplasma capsulatum H143]